MNVWDEKLKEIICDKNNIWKNDTQFYTWLRGGIRKVWSSHPLKHNLLKSKVVRVVNDNPKSMKRFPMVNKLKCEVCKDLFPQSMVEVDHRYGGSNTLKCSDDVAEFIFNILYVTSEDLRVVCKDCHKILSYQQKHEIKDFNKAKIEKYIISLKGKAELDFFISRRIETPSNSKKRREEMRKILYKENKLSGGLHE